MADNPFDKFDSAADSGNPFDQFDETAQKPKSSAAADAFVGPTQQQLASVVDPKREQLGTNFLGRVLSAGAGNAALNMLGPIGSTISGFLSPAAKGKVAQTAFEGVAPAVTGMAAGPASGYAGIAGTVLPGPAGQGAAWQSAVQKAMTYSPRTASGQAAADLASAPGQALDKVADRAGGAVAETTGLPALGAATKTAIDVGVPALAGRVVNSAMNSLLPEPAAPGPTIAELKAKADAAYAAGRASPEVAPQSKLAPVISDVEQMLTDNGYDPELHPATARSLNKLYQEATRPDVSGHNATGLESVRRVLTSAENKAYNSQNWDDFRLANEVTDRFDQMVREAAPDASQAFNEGRAAFSTMRKTQTIEQLINRAENAANGQNQAGYENALRIQFRQLADSKRFNQFTPDEQAAIQQVARGSGWLQNTLRNTGRGAVRGPITGGLAALLAASHGSPLALAGILLTEFARGSAAAMREGDALAARNLVASGGQVPAEQAAPVTPQTVAAPALLAPTNPRQVNQENPLDRLRFLRGVLAVP